MQAWTQAHLSAGLETIKERRRGRKGGDNGSRGFGQNMLRRMQMVR